MSIQEVDIRLNKLEYANTANVTTSAQNIEELFTDIPAAAKANLKTLMIHNASTNDIFFGTTDGVTTADGAPINGAETREFPIKNIENPIYFIAAETDDIRIEIWS